MSIQVRLVLRKEIELDEVGSGVCMRVSCEIFDRIGENAFGDVHALVGFDAVVDHLVNVVKCYDECGNVVLFSTIDEFGKYLCKKKGMSCCLELRGITSKLGGNMANMSLAMSMFGVPVSCIGTLGEDDNFVYKALAESCDVYSIAPPGNCTALEFGDGKVMLADNASMQVAWRDVINFLGKDTLLALLKRSQILCLVNWSELSHASEIWRELLHFAVDNGVIGIKTVFFDMADFSHRPSTEIRECAAIIASYGKHYETVLGLNENEARIFANAYNLDACSITDIGQALQKKIQARVLVIHTNYSAHAFDAVGNVYESAGFVCENPVTLTGGGDNFNAGYCLGILANLDVDACLLLGNAASGYYVSTGMSANLDQLKSFIKKGSKPEDAKGL